MAKANAKTVVVVRCPGAVLMPWLGEVAAVLVSFLPGQEMGPALASVLFGDVGRRESNDPRCCVPSPGG